MRKFLLLPCIMSSISLFSQNVGIGTTTPDANAILDLGFGTKGLLLPRVTDASMNAMPSPVSGMLLYNANLGRSYMYVGSWKKVMLEGDPFSLPYSGVGNTTSILFSVTQNGLGPAATAIFGNNSQNGRGVFGYSDSGEGISGGSNTGTGGSFSSISGRAITGTGDVWLNRSNGKTMIGNLSSANMQLHIFHASDTALLQLDNNTALANGTNVGAYFKNGSWFTGAIKTIGTGTNVARMGFYTFAATDQNGLLERMTILDNGNVGIGTNNPTTKLEVGGTVKITGGSPGSGKVLTSDASGNASWQTPDVSSGYQHLVEISVIGTSNWVVPAGVTSVLVEAWGDGGDGTTSTANLLLGGGGGGAGYCKSIIQVTPGSTITVLRVSGDGSSGGKTRVTYTGDYMEAQNGDNGNAGGGGRGGTVIRGGTGFSLNWYAAKGNSGDDNYQHSIETETGSKQIFYHGGKGGDCYNGKGGKGDVWRVLSGQPIANGFDMGAVGFPSGWGAGGGATTGYTTGNLSSVGQSGGVLIYY
ncbi:MAG: hypothetical protein V9F01_11820 [Chitinophagaceae bacterium]